MSVQLKRRGVETKLVLGPGGNTAGPDRIDPPLVKLIGRAHRWFGEVASGGAGSFTALAARESLAASYVMHLARLALLAPDITEAILAGRQPVELTAARLTSLPELPIDWSEQRRLLGF
jgi:hypothetical protein